MFIIIVSILFRRVNTKRTRQVHRLQNQIDTLEMRVARECKEGNSPSPSLPLQSSVSSSLC